MIKFRINGAGGNNIGILKNKNESNIYFDGFYLKPDQKDYPSLVRSISPRDLNLYAICDGIGIPSGGDHAAYIAVSQLEKAHDKLYCETFPYWDGIMDSYVRSLNEALLDEAIEMRKDYGVSFSAVGFDGRYIRAYNIGKCSVYMLRNGKLTRLTRPYNVNEPMITGLGPADEIQATGTFENAQKEVFCAPKIEMRRGDTFLVCNSGIDSALNQKRLIALLSDSAQPEVIVNNLIQMAIDNGSCENISAIVIKTEKDPMSSFMGSKKGAWLIGILTVLILLLTAAAIWLGIWLGSDDSPATLQINNKSVNNASQQILDDIPYNTSQLPIDL